MLWIATQSWTTSPMVVTWSYPLSLRQLVLLIPQILLCCVHLFETSHAMFMRIKLWMELVLNRQPVPSFFMSLWGNMKKNLWGRMTSFCLHLICFILTSSMILPFFSSCENLSLDVSTSDHSHNMWMSLFHLIVERTNISS